MMKEQQKKLIKICVWSAIIIFVIRCVISWNSIIGMSFYALFGYASEAVSIALMFAVAYEKLLWKINPFESTPKLAHQYKGTLKSNYNNVEKTALLIIKQTLLSVHITLITDESKSRSLSASIDEIMGEKQLIYCYLNTSKSEYRDRSEMHYGTAILSIVSCTTLDGQYYTDRKTRGDMFFVQTNKSGVENKWNKKFFVALLPLWLSN